MGWKLGQWLFLLALSASAACGELTQATVGYVPPSDGFPNTAWATVPGAFAYRVVVSLDRSGTAPVGSTALVSEHQLDPSKIAWHEGHPILDRPYFWVVLAYDRPDPRGVLLGVTEPREIHFSAIPAGLQVNYQEPTPSPMPSTTTAPPVGVRPS